MSQKAQPWEYYEVGEIITEGEGYQVFHAIETSLSAPCIYHKIFFDKVTGEQKDAAVAELKRFAMMNHPRAPRLADAWFQEESLDAVEYRSDTRPLGLQEDNPLHGEAGLSAAEFCDNSLELLAALHACGIVHRDIQADTFGLGRQNRLYLTHTGIDHTLAGCFNVKEIDSSMLLSSKLFARDVGRWAFMVLSMMRRQPLCNEDINEKWDDFAFQSARDNLPPGVKRDPLNHFFMKALGGMGAWPEQFDNAADALGFWRENKLGDVIR